MRQGKRHISLALTTALALCLFLLCFCLASCSSGSGTPDPQKEQFASWSSYLSSVQGENIGFTGWPMGKENLTNDELAQLLHNAASRQTESSEETFGVVVWTLSMYVNAPSDDVLDSAHGLNLDAGLQENLVCISGGNAAPDGKFYVEDRELYQMVRSINDFDAVIDEAALSAYQETIDRYLAKEQSRVNNPAVTVELLSVKERVDRSDIGVSVYTLGTVWTSDSPEELLKVMAGGAYFDSQLRLHPDGNSALSNMLVINETPVGFLPWEALSEIESRQDFSSSEELLSSIQDNTACFIPIAREDG